MTGTSTNTIDISLRGFEPCEIGLPDKFTEFRQEQIEAVEQIVNSTKRVDALGLPTGAGKSLVALAAAKVTGLRTIVLTPAKGLQEQYLKDFESAGLVDIRGRSNYQCGDYANLNCRSGPHEGCRLTKGAGCVYDCARAKALASDLVLSNYAYWVHSNSPKVTANDKGLASGVGMLILDEAHRAPEELSKSLQVQLRESWLASLGWRHERTDDLGYWVGFAAEHGKLIEEEIRTTTKELRATSAQGKKMVLRNRLYAYEELAAAFGNLIRMRPDEWVCEMRVGTKWGRQWDFDCVWPGAWASSRLFCGVSKVVLMSAILRPITLAMLGVKKEDYEFREWGRVFPAHQTPIYHIPTVRLNHKIDEDGIDKWVKTIDEIIASRLDRKGIIHTVSYQRQQQLLQKSRFAKHMVTNTTAPDSESASEVVRKFKDMAAPAILVSPSFSTGWDFPGREAEWQIIGKIAFPESRSKVMQARKARNEQYINYLAMQDLVQACGRGTRSAQDRCEVFVVDDNIEWFLWRNKSLAPKWFEVRKVMSIPQPGPRVSADL